MPVAMSIKKKFTFFIIAGAILYFLLSYHIILIGQSVKLLKKSTYTLEYTLFSAKGKTNKMILAIDVLREDGIGDLLIEEGFMTEDEEFEILEILDAEGYKPDQPF